jgi:hypothetical protein
LLESKIRVKMEALHLFKKGAKKQKKEEAQ